MNGGGGSGVTSSWGGGGGAGYGGGGGGAGVGGGGGSSVALPGTNGAILVEDASYSNPTTGAGVGGRYVENGLEGKGADGQVIISYNTISYYSSPYTYQKNQAVSITPTTVLGVPGTYKYTISPALPQGLQINETTGTISGNPRTSQTGTYTVSLQDSTNLTWATTTVTLTITITIKSTTVPIVYSGGLISASSKSE